MLVYRCLGANRSYAIYRRNLVSGAIAVAIASEIAGIATTSYPLQTYFLTSLISVDRLGNTLNFTPAIAYYIPNYELTFS